MPSGRCRLGGGALSGKRRESRHRRLPRLVQLVGDGDLHALANEIDKIVIWAQGEPVGSARSSSSSRPSRDVRRSRSPTPGPETRRGRSRLPRRSSSDERPRRDTAPRLAGSLGGHLTRMRQLKRLAAEGVPPREAAPKLKMHPFYGEKVYRQAEAFSDEELARRDRTAGRARPRAEGRQPVSRRTSSCNGH